MLAFCVGRPGGTIRKRRMAAPKLGLAVRPSVFYVVHLRSQIERSVKSRVVVVECVLNETRLGTI